LSKVVEEAAENLNFLAVKQIQLSGWPAAGTPGWLSPTNLTCKSKTFLLMNISCRFEPKYGS
jgi:hypothetical protein